MTLTRSEEAELLSLLEEEKKSQTVFGIFDPSDPVTPVRNLIRIDGEWHETDLPYEAKIPIKLEPVLTRSKRFVVIIGGRGSGKSEGMGSICASEMNDNGAKVACFREIQNSIADSVKSIVDRHLVAIAKKKFTSTDKSIVGENDSRAVFRGLKANTDSVKSLDNFSIFWAEESQSLKGESIKDLTPTMRTKGGRMYFTGNPKRKEDPFSKRFIVPFQTELERDGIYEDDLHLIIVLNYSDNPWFPEELEQERQFDFETLERAYYDHIWEGRFNDSVKNGLVRSEWFDACVDAHLKIKNIKKQGVRRLVHDPSDLGDDPKAYIVRHGNVITEAVERDDLDVNEGMDWACGRANEIGIDHFEWDVGGMGVSLKRQASEAFAGKSGVAIRQFNGASKPDDDDMIYESATQTVAQSEKTIGDMLKNLRAQCYLSLRDRCYLTYRAVVHGDMIDPEKMISFSSDIECLSAMKSELTSIPVKPNASGRFELYTKSEMREKFKVKSPNIADCVMMSERKVILQSNEKVYIPRPRGRM